MCFLGAGVLVMYPHIHSSLPRPPPCSRVQKHQKSLFTKKTCRKLFQQNQSGKKTFYKNSMLAFPSIFVVFLSVFRAL
jgi:hypothetical protein